MTNPQMISALFDTLLDAATKVGLAAAALFLAWAGFLYMTAGGSPRRMESAKDAAALGRRPCAAAQQRGSDRSCQRPSAA